MLGLRAEPVLHLTADEASLLGIILLPLADRAHKYVGVGALTGRDAEVLANLADRLDVWFDGDDQQPQDLHESEEELVRACWRLRTGPQCCGLSAEEQGSYAKTLRTRLT